MRVSLVLIAAAIGAALVPLPPATVERMYSTGVYGAIQPIVTSVSNLAPIALLDVALVAVAVGWLALAVRDIRAGRRQRVRTVGRIALRTATWSAALYLAFLALWGLNYRRVPLAAKLARADAPVDARLVARVATNAVARVNTLYAIAHARDSVMLAPSPALRTATARAAREVGASASVVPARPKRTLLDWYFLRAGVSGMTDPFFLETLIASDVLPFERPFVTAHEWSHLAGVADEGDANFVGWLACIHSEPADQYSGWMFLYEELIGAVARADRRAIADSLAEGPRKDLQAARERALRHINPRLSAAGWQVYDSYLKANRIEAGAASYNEVVRLVLGTRFSADWTPVLTGNVD